MGILKTYIVLFQFMIGILLFSMPDSNMVKPPNGRGLVVIVHESINVGDIAKIDAKKLLDIYTLNEQTWEDGSRIYIADFKGDTKTRTDFYKYLEIKQNAIKKIWLRAQFTGKSIPPSIVESEDEMIQKVQDKPGTIGYVTESELPKNVKIVARLK